MCHCNSWVTPGYRSAAPALHVLQVSEYYGSCMGSWLPHSSCTCLRGASVLFGMQSVHSLEPNDLAISQCLSCRPRVFHAIHAADLLQVPACNDGCIASLSTSGNEVIACELLASISVLTANPPVPGSIVSTSAAAEAASSVMQPSIRSQAQQHRNQAASIKSDKHMRVVSVARAPDFTGYVRSALLLSLQHVLAAVHPSELRYAQRDLAAESATQEMLEQRADAASDTDGSEVADAREARRLYEDIPALRHRATLDVHDSVVCLCPGELGLFAQPLQRSGLHCTRDQHAGDTGNVSDRTAVADAQAGSETDMAQHSNNRRQWRCKESAVYLTSAGIVGSVDVLDFSSQEAAETWTKHVPAADANDMVGNKATSVERQSWIGEAIHCVDTRVLTPLQQTQSITGQHMLSP